MLGIELLRLHDKSRDPERGELAMEVKASGSGFIDHKHPVGQGPLFLHVGQEALRDETLSRLRRLAIAHPDHPEMIGVPIHTQFELLDVGLRFGGWKRRTLFGMVECVFHIQELSPVAPTSSTHAFFFR